MKKTFFIIFLLAFVSGCVPPASKLNSNAASSMIEVESANKLFREGEYKKAVLAYKKITEKSELTGEDKFNYAESLRLSGNVKGAIDLYNDLIASGDNELAAMEGKSLCYVQDGEFKKAAVLLSKVLNKDAARWRTINALGVIYASTGHLEESLKYYNMALDISGNNPSIVNNIGLTIAFSGKLEEGKKIVEKALHRLDADDKRARQVEYNLALINGISGNMEEAEKILSKYLPNYKVMNNLGYYAKLADDKELARTYLSKALAASPVHYEKAYNSLQELGGKG